MSTLSIGCRPLLDSFHRHAGHCCAISKWPVAHHDSAQPRGRPQFCHPWHGIRCAQAQPHAASETLHMAVKVCVHHGVHRDVSLGRCAPQCQSVLHACIKETYCATHMRCRDHCSSHHHYSRTHANNPGACRTAGLLPCSSAWRHDADGGRSACAAGLMEMDIVFAVDSTARA